MKLIPSIGLIGILAASASALADTPPLPVSDSGLVTVLGGQTAKLNVVNVDPDPNSSCQFTLSFIDSAGVVLPAGQLPVVNVAGGASALPLEVVVAAGPASLRAHIDFTPQLMAHFDDANPLMGCYHLIPTFEVVDATGTRVINTSFTGLPSFEKGKKLDKVWICHKPGTPAEHSLLVPVSALKGHMGHKNHNDTLGPCAN